MEIGNKEIEIEGETEGGPASSSLEGVLEDVGISSSNGFGNRKKMVMVLGFIVILVIGVGVFYWENRDIKGSPDDYVINGTIIENKRAGMKIQAPEGWDIEKIELLEGSMVMKSQDIDGEMRNNTISPPLTKGCGIETAVVYERMNFDEIKEEIKDIHFGLAMISEEFEEIEINNRKALKNTFDSHGLGPGMSISFIENASVYSFCVYWGPDDKERCVKEFEEMLDKVEIE